MQENAFEIEVNAPYALNYMVFLQNIYLNQNRYQEDRQVFPYVDSSKWGLLGNVQFVDAFKEVWETLLQKNLNKRFDHNGILTDEKALFQRLFQGTAAGVFGFEESSKAFLVWWISFAGKIAVERVFEGDAMTKLYKELAGSVKTTRENNRLNIALLYDRLVLCGSFQQSWYLTLPIEDVFLINRRPELLELMRNSCN
ncbi:hypothetical protein [Cytobacillus oceanisediminis]|uniref:hypothetical protein n=1 Tax=Cytobacillus oceanisediminis TaxID=665099 RepID=UPI0011A63CC9|nr:hypothetical protein [Cytobacillus oceanisediminis]